MKRVNVREQPELHESRRLHHLIKIRVQLKSKVVELLAQFIVAVNHLAAKIATEKKFNKNNVLLIRTTIKC